MDNLPPELLNLIVSYVTNLEDRNSLCRVSRNFQLTTERFTFQNISITSTPQSLEKFSHLFRFVHRRKALRQIAYSIVLPGYSVRSCKLFESKRARERNNEAFTKAIVGLFEVLSSWDRGDGEILGEQQPIQEAIGARASSTRLNVEARGARGYARKTTWGMNGRGVDLRITKIYSSTDPGYQTPEQEALFLAQSPWLDRYDRFRYSYLRLVVPEDDDDDQFKPKCKSGSKEIDSSESTPATNEFEQQPVRTTISALDEMLPILPRIVTFVVNGNSLRMIEVASVIKIASRFPNLKYMDLAGMTDAETRVPALRRSMRMDFGQTLLRTCQSGSFNNLVSFEIYLECIEPFNHAYSVSALHPSHPDTDFLSLGFNAIARLPCIKDLKTNTICISPSAFWPTSTESGSLSWPSLECLTMTLACCTPSGGWYIKPDPSLCASPKPDNDSIYSSDSEDDSNADNFSYQYWSDRSESEPDSESYPSSPDNPGILSDSLRSRREARKSGEAPCNFFRSTIDPTTFNPLIYSLAKAVAKMPKLGYLDFQLALLQSDDLPEDQLVFSCLVYGAGTQNFEWENLGGKEEDEKVRRWVFDVGLGLKWDMEDWSEELKQALKEAVGPGGIVKMHVLSGYERSRSGVKKLGKVRYL